MTGPLTYPPEIVIEGKIDLPPEFEACSAFGQGSNEVRFELTWLLIEFVIELIGGW